MNTQSSNPHYPLSFQQKMMWILFNMEPENPMWNIHDNIRLKGKLNKRAIKAAIKAIVTRHASFRTYFQVIQKQPYQLISESLSFDTYFIDYDLSSFSESESETKAKALGEQIIRTPFCFDKSPLFKVLLITINQSDHILLFCMHHIVADEASLLIIWRELADLYNAFASNSTVILTPLQKQYYDYALWQQQDNSYIIALKKQEKYWLKQFSNNLPFFNIPTDYTRTSVQRYQSATVTTSISKRLSQKLRSISFRNKVTLFSTLLSAYVFLLHKYSGQNDILIGILFAGRGNDKALSHLIGFFVNTLPIRIQLTQYVTFLELLKHVHLQIVAAHENQDYPFDQLVKKINPERDISHAPLFQIMFNKLMAYSGKHQFQNLSQEEWGQLELKHSFYDINITVYDKPDNISVRFQYCTDIFKKETIIRMIEHYQNILETIASNIEINLFELEMLSPLELRQLLIEFNNTTCHYPNDVCIHELYKQQVKKRPDKIAVIYKNKHLTYEELEHKSNQLAHVLREKGVMHGKIAAFIIERSIEMVIAILAVLKTGGAYLPIAFDYPLARKKFILKDSNAHLLITTKYLNNIDNAVSQVVDSEHIIYIDDESCYTDHALQFSNPMNTQNCAYVIYTSGSTGIPKGVQVTHRNVVNFLMSMRKRPGISENDILLAVTELSFDISVLELLLPLITGSQVVIASKEVTVDGFELAKMISQYNVTIMQGTPATWKLLLNARWQGSHQLTVLCGGEALTPFLTEQLIKRCKGLWNMYGPTETTVWSTTYSILSAESILIGQPIANTMAYILDGYLKPVPIGITGELCLSGEGVSKGYLNRDDQQRKSFIKNPFSPKQILYKTGDLARWTASGNIEFRGRIDNQVKLRGYRIECGEIENCLQKHPEIKDAVVVVKTNEKQDEYLCAYIVTEKEFTVSELKEFLSRQLPDYMIPSFFITLEKVPLTASGKIDRKALPEAKKILLTGKKHTAPRNKVEQQIADVWKQVLKAEKISVHDNFFELGGDSLNAIVLISILTNHFDVTVKQIFQYQTVAELANHIFFKKDNLQNRIETIKNNVLSEMAVANVVANQLKEDYQTYRNSILQEKLPNLSVTHQYRHILLTGATGFLGAHLVYALLQTTNAVLHLPVRENTSDKADGRLKKKLAFYFGEDLFVNYRTRIRVVKSDLKEKALGIVSKQYEMLSASVDSVIHAAANVRHFGMYKDSYEDNVIATERLLEFAVTKRKKDFHYISTTSVGIGDIAGKNYILFTENCTDIGQSSDNVYIKTKLEAENKAFAYRAKGIRISIYRMGNLLFHSETGKTQENIHDNAFYARIKTFLQLGMIPDLKNMRFDITFVDYAARAIALLMTRKKIANETFHIYNHKELTWTKFFMFLKNTGIKIELLTVEQFLEQIKVLLNNSDYRMMIERFLLHSEFSETEKGVTKSMIVSDRTQRLLNQIGFQWPEVTAISIKKMLTYYKSVEFLT
ncbi:MAG: amino acid adenylation domain-containing protein [Desulfobacterales bacterium]